MSDLYVARDGYDNPTIWLRTPEHIFGDRPVLVRTPANARGFDALAVLIGTLDE